MRLRASQQLFLSYLLLIAVLITALSAGAESRLRRILVEGVERQLAAELSLAATFYDASTDLPADSVADLLGRRSGHRVTVIAPDGVVLGESARDGVALSAMENHAARPEVREAVKMGRGGAIRASETVGRNLLYATVRSSRGDIVRVATPLTEVDAAVSRAQRGIFGVGALAVLLAVGLSLGFSVAVTRPLRRVTAAARAAAAGDLSIRLRESRSDELGEVAGALDSLAEELQRRVLQVEEERAEMQALIDSMSEGVLALARDGTVRRANPAARRMFGLGRRAQGLTPEAVARRPDFLRLVRRALAGETVTPTEFVSDGRSVLATAHPLPDGGAVLVFLDVSELRRLEGVRRDFVANASHELKTPLTAIRGYSETMLDPELAPELVRKFANVVKVNADRLQRIVDDLLDLSRVESGGWKIEPERLSVTKVATEAWSAETTVASRTVALSFMIDPAADLVYADPAAVRQVFSNLFSNALRYTPEGGSITVRADVSTRPGLEGESRPRWVKVEVQDTGSGIPSVHVARIFERFYRVDPARSRETEGGTGLGLSIVKHLVEAHGGSADARSEIGSGTVIRFTLPLAPA
ncbi:MAG: HAMP domain-containing protein [Gemmatimonadetes bacterium]|nr:HAMP domain-containing protein [Gemmatimonadota bacterium]